MLDACEIVPLSKVAALVGNNEVRKAVVGEPRPRKEMIDVGRSFFNVRFLGEHSFAAIEALAALKVKKRLEDDPQCSAFVMEKESIEL